jgi:hypothetical protein
MYLEACLCLHVARVYLQDHANESHHAHEVFIRFRFCLVIQNSKMMLAMFFVCLFVSERFLQSFTWYNQIMLQKIGTTAFDYFPDMSVCTQGHANKSEVAQDNTDTYITPAGKSHSFVTSQKPMHECLTKDVSVIIMQENAPSACVMASKIWSN